MVWDLPGNIPLKKQTSREVAHESASNVPKITGEVLNCTLTGHDSNDPIEILVSCNISELSSDFSSRAC